MADLAALQAQLDALRAAYHSGVRTVAYDGKSVGYGSAAELRQAISSLEAEISGAVPVRSFVVRSEKGW